MTSVTEPTPVLAVTTRVRDGAPLEVIAASVAALHETARRMSVVVTGAPVRLEHASDELIEVCLPIAALPDEDPPAPIAAEVLVPGTILLPLPPS